MPIETTILLGAKVEKDEAAELRVAASKIGVSVSDVIRMALKDWLKRNGETK